MIKETKTTKTIDVVTKKRFCDDCGKDITYNSSLSTTCIMCGKDVCDDCIGNYEYSGDYPEVTCKSCWTIGEPYRNKVQAYRNKVQELEDEIDQLNSEWTNKCKREF